MASYTLAVKVNLRVRTNVLVSSNVCLYKPFRVTMSQENQQSYCQTIRADIEDHLKRAIPLKAPLSVFEPMRHLSLPDSPNSAPALCVAACELVGGHRSQAMAAAAALHLVHAAMFSHENLPLTVRPTLRPNPGTSPTHVFAPNVELLIPDAMVPFGLELVATSSDPDQNSSYQILRVILEITRVAGSQGIVDGVYKETRTGQSDGGEEDACRKKEGALHACAAACGAILGGAKEEEIEALRKYGLYVGMLRGYSSRVVEIKGNEWERVVEMRSLAIKELEHFKGRNVEAISSFLMGQ